MLHNWIKYFQNDFNCKWHHLYRLGLSESNLQATHLLAQMKTAIKELYNIPTDLVATSQVSTPNQHNKRSMFIAGKILLQKYYLWRKHIVPHVIILAAPNYARAAKRFLRL